MPSTQYPSTYTRSGGDKATGDMAEFFRYLTPEEAVEETGSTEAPVGHVMLIEVTHELIADMTRDYLPTDRFWDAVPMPGWYIVKRDDNGLVWGLTYGYGTHAESNARADFGEAQNVYGAWIEADCDCGTPAGYHTSDCYVYTV